METKYVYTDLSDFDNTVYVSNENHVTLMEIPFIFAENRSTMKAVVEKYAKEKFKV